MARLDWHDELELGVAPMDATHREFVDLLGAFADAPDANQLTALDRLIDHTVAHFGQEDRWMDLSGFVPPCHRGEHGKVLEVMRQVRDRVATGDSAIGRTLALELGRWFEHHAATMDTILVSHMVEVGFDPVRGTTVPAVAAGGAAEAA